MAKSEKEKLECQNVCTLCIFYDKCSENSKVCEHFCSTDDDFSNDYRDSIDEYEGYFNEYVDQYSDGNIDYDIDDDIDMRE